ncbi:MAG TPA: hypothetical protein VMS71_03240 [Candidatus Acidoferrum sp.]|nr:hypothetical protein [Candidatus Acidoferrum sp.]
MTATVPVQYVRTQLINHARLFFTDVAVKILQSDAVKFLPYADAAAVRAPAIVIPTDIPIPPSPQSRWRVPFNGTELTLWNPVPRPSGDTWSAVSSGSAPAWYQHNSGTLMPAWNLFGNLFDLLTFGEEFRSNQRDRHGRFDWRFSPRLSPGLLTVPAVNEAVALLADASVSLSRSKPPSFILDCLSGPPVVVLSHDCDLLTGNDFITQAVRLYRTFQPLTRFRLPRPGNLWWIVRNAVTPRRYYFDNVTGMLDIERCFRFTSTLYLLNGAKGRFGARSPLAETRRLAKLVPPAWEIGMHYNYNTFLDPSAFSSQLDQLKQIVPNRIISGRAHYLHFDPFRSFSFLQQYGICTDESSGWPDYVGFRNGIAGCFQAYDLKQNTPLDIWEVPLTIVENALANQHGAESLPVVENLLRHLRSIGGALTILFHPGRFHNPESPRTLFLYHEILKAGRRVEATSLTARQLVDRIRDLS